MGGPGQTPLTGGKAEEEGRRFGDKGGIVRRRRRSKGKGEAKRHMTRRNNGAVKAKRPLKKGNNRG